MELETQIIIARRLGFMAQQGCNRLLSLTAELRRMLAGLRQKLARLDRHHKLKPETCKRSPAQASGFPYDPVSLLSSGP